MSPRARTTAWGGAWIESLVLGRTFEGVELSRGRGLAARGGVRDLEVEPGSVGADVVRPRSTVRRVRIGFRRFSPEDFEQVRSVLASSARWAAAVLDGELPTEVHDRLAAAGLPLLPGVHDISIDCSCGNQAESCVHAAAVCAALATALDADPLLLVTLRGGDRGSLVAGFDLHLPVAGESSSGRLAAIVDRGPDPAVPAATAWRRRPSALEDLVVVPARRGGDRWAVGLAPPPVELGLDRVAVEALVGDAARRAADVLAGVPGGAALHLDAVTDAVRRAAAGTVEVSVAAAAVGDAGPGIDSLVAAWMLGGAAAVEVLTAPTRLDESSIAIVAAAVERPVRARSTGALLDDGRQVRRSVDGTWVLLRPDEVLGWVVIDVAADVDELTFDELTVD